MNDAIANLITVIQSITGLSYNDQAQDAGSSPFTASLATGQLETDYFFGKNKLRQTLILLLQSKGTENSPADVYTMNKAIKDAIESDRRRGGNAQTTVAGDWESGDDEGREGLTQTLTVEIHVYENQI